MAAFYNENDPYAAQWLRNLIAAGHIASGVVDERDIREIEAFELFEYTQCHFFAGIGIWSKALRDAGWPDDRPIWTGSCPCQPFSNAGKQKGFRDGRHLWPYWYNLIRKRAPPIVVGEQVASALAWLDLVSADMEAADYAFGAADLCAAGFDGAHIRQRLYFVGLADSDNTGSQRRHGMLECAGQRPTRKDGLVSELVRGGETLCNPGQARPRNLDDADWLLCRNPAGEPSWRPVEPGTFPLAHGVAARVGKLRAYGNGLDLETATEFVSAVMECLP